MSREAERPYRACVGVAVFNQAGKLFLGRRKGAATAAMRGRCRRAASIPARARRTRRSANSTRRPTSARCARLDESPRLARLRPAQDPGAAGVERTLPRPAAALVRLPLRGRGQRDRRRGAGRRAAQAGIRRLALGAVEAVPDLVDPVQARHLPGRAERLRGFRAGRRTRQRLDDQSTTILTFWPGTTRLVGAQAVEKLEQLHAGARCRSCWRPATPRSRRGATVTTSRRSGRSRAISVADRRRKVDSVSTSACSIAAPSPAVGEDQPEHAIADLHRADAEHPVAGERLGGRRRQAVRRWPRGWSPSTRPLIQPEAR